MRRSHLARPPRHRNDPSRDTTRGWSALRARALLLALAGLFIVLVPAAHGSPVVELSGRIEAASDQAARVVATVVVADGYHINAHQPDEEFLIPTVLTASAPGVEFGEPRYPTPVARRFEFAGEKPMLVYDGKFDVVVEAKPRPQAAVEVSLRYQACDDERCLPPATVRATIAPDEVASAAASTADPTAPNLRSARAPDNSLVTRWLAGASLPGALLVTLLLGLTLNLTPCVYPLVSVTIGYFGSQSASGSARAPWPLACAYVLGITLSFAVLGVSAALFGGLFGAPLQHPAVLVGLAIVMTVLAGASFGFYEIRAPSAIVNRVGGASAGIGGALLMGLTMGVVAAPCIGPVILGLLVYVGSQRDAVLGFLLFFALGLGMGLPYVLLASAAGAIRKLPRSGEWLAWVNRLFGTLLLGMALYFVSPLLDEQVLAVLAPLYLAAAALYLGFLEPSARGVRWFVQARRAFGLAVLLVAAWVALPNAQARDGIRWQPLSPEALDAARAAGRPAIVEFAADWCLPCLEMKRTTFVNPEVTREAARFVTLVADVTESSARNDALLAEFGVVGVPTIIFYASDGSEIDRLVGYVGATEFRAAMRRVLGDAPDARPDDDAPSLTRLREQRRDVVAAKPVERAAHHVGAERVHLEVVALHQLVHQVVARRGYE